MPSTDLIKAIAVTAELCGRVFSESAAAVFFGDVAAYTEKQVMGALVRCRREVRGVLTLQDVISRLDDGRPGVEEAWSMLPHDEAKSAVWTVEMSQAFGVAVRLIDEGDVVAARMAFKETYQRMVQQARDQGRAVSWSVTLGHDIRGREGALIEAVDKGRLTYEQAKEFIPELPRKSAVPMIDARPVIDALRLTGEGTA